MQEKSKLSRKPYPFFPHRRNNTEELHRLVPAQSIDKTGGKNGGNSSSSSSKAGSLRKREVALSKVSIYIVFVFVFCHSVRLIPNLYELYATYIKPV